MLLWLSLVSVIIIIRASGLTLNDVQKQDAVYKIRFELVRKYEWE